MAERTILVVDTSVLVKWFSDEEYTDAALRLRDAYVENDVDIYVPDLLLYELANALRYNPEFDAGDVQTAIQSLLDMDFEIVTPTPHLLKTAIGIAHEHDLTVYDSTFVALGETLEGLAVTADEELAELDAAAHVTEF